MPQPIPFGVVDHLLMRLGSSDVQKIGSMYGVLKDVGELEEELATIKAVLVDVDEKQKKCPRVGLWVKMLEDFVYDADDLLDDIATYHQQRRVVARKVGDFFSSSNQLAFRRKMGHRLKRIKDVVDALIIVIPMLNLIPRNITHSGAESSWRETLSFVLPSEIVVGREENKEYIIKSLVSPHNQEIPSTVAIVGMGGLGKTTLARLVYNDEKVVQYFEPRIWVCVSDHFDVKWLVKRFLGSINIQNIEGFEWDALKDKLQEELSQKKYLLVLDDASVEDFEKWDQLRALLMVGAKGSKIVVTTRSNRVASVLGSASVVHLEPLGPSQSLHLFSEIAPRREQEKVHPNLEAIRREIVDMCQGVPLLIRTLGAILYFKTEESLLLSMKKSSHEAIYLASFPLLNLIYDNLPPHLKQCFAYCALFPKDHEIEKKLLVQLWMAQGYIESLDRDEHLEDIGNQYFEDLLSRSLFEEVIEGVNDNIKRYKMDGLIHDLAQSVMRNVVILTDDNKNLFDVVKHVSLFEVSGPLSLVTKNLLGKSLRSFLVFSLHDCKYESMVNRWISSCKSLRALELKMLEVKKVPRCLGKLGHLRYLDLSYNDFMVLPNAITSLKNLQTLKLVHCRNLKEFPKNTRELINLRHLENDGCINLTYMPFGIGDLTLLQSLSIFVIGNGRGHSRDNKIGSLLELKRLNHLRGELYIKNLENVRDGARETKEENLKEKQYLQSLRLEWGPSEQEAKDDELVMESLQPHPNLKKLYVKGYGGGRFPSWMMNDELYLLLPNLLHIHLEGCKRSQILPPFAQLPFLQSLELNGLDEVEYMMECSSEMPFFPSLQRLQLSYLCKLNRLWRTDLPAEQRPLFPCLYQLVIEYCDSLTSLTLPSSPCLSKLEITSCDNLTSLPLPPLPCLSTLHLSQCPNLASLELHSSPHLCYLCIKSCPYLASLKMPSLPHLEVLDLHRVREEVWQQLMFVSSSLKSLSIWQLYKTG